MSRKITPSGLTEEFVSDSQRVMFYGFAVMIATALAFALIAALTISRGIVESDSRVSYLVRVPYWCVSALAVCMVYIKVHTYGRFITHRMTARDVIIPFTKALIASGLFAVLTVDGPRLWHYWPFVFSAFAGVSHWKIRYYITRFDETKAPLETAKLIRMMKENTRKTDLPNTLMACVSFFVAGVLVNFIPPPHFMTGLSTNWQALLAIPAGFGIVMAIHSDKQVRAEVDRLTEEERETGRQAVTA
jgi:hypothetical protein